MFRIVITDLKLDFATKSPVLVTITIFNASGVEQLRTSIPAKLCRGRLAIGQELIFTPKEAREADE
jgi:hypothetical protein